MKILLFVLILALNIKSYAAEVTWNLNTTYGITQTGIANAITDAKAHFLTHPDDI